LLAVGLALATAATLSACAVDSATTTSEEPAATMTAAESVQLVDPWVKAVDDGMTAAFGTLENTGDADVTLVSAQSSASSMVELHETVMTDGQMQMQQKDGGFVITAGRMREFAPGADHIMLMGVTQPLLPGDQVMITLTFSDGSSIEKAFEVKEFTGADEEYMGDLSDSGNE